MSQHAAPSPFERADVVERYEAWYATPYGRVADRIEQGLLLELLHPLQPGATLLELGCGTAHFSAAFTARGFRVTGVDPSLAMLRAARARVPVACGAGERLPFTDGAFDGVFLISVLEFVADPALVLREARRVARARVVVLAITSRSWLGARRRVAGLLGHPIFSQAKFRTRAALLALAHASGAPVECSRSALVLPPSLAGRFPLWEERLSRRSPWCGGVLGFALAGGGRATRPSTPP